MSVHRQARCVLSASRVKPRPVRCCVTTEAQSLTPSAHMPWQRCRTNKSLHTTTLGPLPTATVPPQQLAGLPARLQQSLGPGAGPCLVTGKCCSRLWGTSAAQVDTHFIIPQGGSPVRGDSRAKAGRLE